MVQSINNLFLTLLNDHNVPCAVCYTSVRSSKLMIPGETTCPSMWTQEYVGYLMAESYPDHKRNAVYECVDKDSEAVPGGQANTQWCFVLSCWCILWCWSTLSSLCC